MGMIIVSIGSVSNTSWANWDEYTQVEIGTDGIIVLDNPADGGHDTGVCSDLSGADLVLTVAGNAPGFPGATGSPYPSRLTDGASDWAQTTEAWWNNFYNAQTKYFLCIKLNITAGYDDLDTIFYFEDTNLQMSADISSNKLRAQLYDNDNALEALSSTDNITTGSIIYLCVFCDGTTNYTGWTVGTKPTKLTDFDAGKLITFTRLFDNMAAMSTAVWNAWFDLPTINRWLAARIYFIYAASNCPIST